MLGEWKLLGENVVYLMVLKLALRVVEEVSVWLGGTISKYRFVSIHVISLM